MINQSQGLHVIWLLLGSSMINLASSSSSSSVVSSWMEIDPCGVSPCDAFDVDGDWKLESELLLTALKALLRGSAIFRSEFDKRSGSGLTSGRMKLEQPMGENPRRSSSDGHSISPSNDAVNNGKGTKFSGGLTDEKAISWCWVKLCGGVWFWNVFMQLWDMCSIICCFFSSGDSISLMNSMVARVQSMKPILKLLNKVGSMAAAIACRRFFMSFKCLTTISRMSAFSKRAYRNGCKWNKFSVSLSVVRVKICFPFSQPESLESH